MCHFAQHLLPLDHDQQKKESNWRLLNFGFNIKANILCAFVSSKNFKKERKLFKTPQTSFLMLRDKQINSNVTS